MAGTAGFRFAKNLDGGAYTPSLLYYIGRDAIVFTVGDQVRLTTQGTLDHSVGGEQVMGIVATVVDTNGKAHATDSGALNTWTMDADNEAGALDEVAIIPAFGHYGFVADSDTTIATTSLGKYFNGNNTSDGIITSGESDTIGTLQWQAIGVDPNSDGDTSFGLFRCVGSQAGQTTIATRAAE